MIYYDVCLDIIQRDYFNIFSMIPTNNCNCQLFGNNLKLMFHLSFIYLPPDPAEFAFIIYVKHLTVIVEGFCNLV